MLFVVCQWHVSVNAGQNEVANKERGICVGDKTLWLRSRYIKRKGYICFIELVITQPYSVIGRLMLNGLRR